MNAQDHIKEHFNTKNKGYFIIYDFSDGTDLRDVQLKDLTNRIVANK